MSEIKEEQLVKLFFKAADGSEKELDCSIKKIYKDRLSINFPKEIIYYTDYLQEGEEVTAKIFTPSGIKIFDAIILNSPLEPEFIIEFVENYIEVQRRKYLRADLETKVIIERSEKGNIVTRTLDIGGGGVRFLFDGNFDYKETVNCLLYLPMYLSSIKATGIIIKDEHLGAKEYVLVFTKIDERERDKIIKKCIEIQSGNS
jgi:c-di-GMP-binding flagellar brake protein YcgR